VQVDAAHVHHPEERELVVHERHLDLALAPRCLAPKHMPDWIPTRPFVVSTRETPRRKRQIQAPLVNDELALLWMVNMGCIDLNTWYSRVDKPERPDWVLFDLDPSPDVGFRETVEVALLVKQALDALELVSFA